MLYAEQVIERLAETAGDAGLGVRRVNRGGAGGGWTRLRGRLVMFLDLDADPDEELDRIVDHLASSDAPELATLMDEPALQRYLSDRDRVSLDDPTPSPEGDDGRPVCQD